MSNTGKMKGKKVIVTGSGTGIGRGVAREFAREGAAVALHYSHSDRGAQSAVDEIREAGGSAKAFQADFNDVFQAKELAARAIDFLGGLDILVNNAGITMNQPFEQVTPEQYDTLYNVNIRAMFFVTQAAIPTMIEQGDGAIVNVSSTHSSHAMVEHSVYAGTKGAIVTFTRTLALEMAPKGVRVNAIAPGWILVENHLKLLPEDFDEETEGLVLPSGFIGKPRDVARLAIFLASADARYIIGQTVFCDGGESIIMAASGDFREPVKERWGKGYVPGI